MIDKNSVKQILETAKTEKVVEEFVRTTSSIVFIDTEVGVDSQKVQDYGAVRNDGAVLHTQSLQEFNAFVSGCDTICGHNILNFDLQYLHLKGEHRYIDTLPLSPLLFPRKPYHRLVKDDKLQVDELNNPVNDAKKARDLFYDEVEAWKTLSAKRKAIYRGLLENTREFRGFFGWIGNNDGDNQACNRLILQPLSAKNLPERFAHMQI